MSNRATYPYTIDNGSGELLTFTGVTPGRDSSTPLSL